MYITTSVDIMKTITINIQVPKVFLVYPSFKLPNIIYVSKNVYNAYNAPKMSLNDPNHSQR